MQSYALSVKEGYIYTQEKTAQMARLETPPPLSTEMLQQLLTIGRIYEVQRSSSFTLKKTCAFTHSPMCVGIACDLQLLTPPVSGNCGHLCC